MRLLEEVENDPEVSQRHLAGRLGIALGVANLLLRSLAKKGYIRASQVGWKRWVYALTPTGFSRKVHLTLAYTERFLGHYRRVRTLLRDDIGTLMNVESRVAIYGTSELAELMYLALRDVGVTEIEVFDDDLVDRRFLGMPVKSLSSMWAGEYSKVLVAFPADVESRCRELQEQGVAPDQIVTLLHNSRHGAGATENREVSN
jgi:hypothetical protein